FLLSPPETRCYASAVALRATSVSVGIVPGKVNACFAVASFSFGHDKFKFFFTHIMESFTLLSIKIIGRYTIPAYYYSCFQETTVILL
ncbi:MAG: hypothetical protein SO170_00380, partial [Butyribacter sp.]|nr:hypothetical protein [Butyribacter sp.]